MTSEESFRSLEYWYKLIKNANSEDVVISMLGNKSDLLVNPEDRVIKQKDIYDFMKRTKLFEEKECSAKNNTNICDTFEKTAIGNILI